MRYKAERLAHQADQERVRVRAFVPYEIALGDGERARLVLPQDLTQAEADRLCGVIQSLAFDTASCEDRR